MKKILSLTLIGLIIFSLCACQKEGSGVKGTSSEIPPSSQTIGEKPSSKIESTSSSLDEELREVGGGVELLKFAEAFSEIPIGYLNTLDDDYSAFKDKTSFKDIPSLDIALFICNYLDFNNLLWSNYQGEFDYEGYTVPAEDLNMYAKKLFGYEYDFSSIKETNGFGTIYKYLPEKKAFDVGIHGSVWQNGLCEYKGMHRKISEDEYQAEFALWEREEEKPDGNEGTDWKEAEMHGGYWEYDDNYMLTIKKIDGEWKYISFLEIED